MVISLPLSIPLNTGFELTTLIRYPLPATVFEGIVAIMVPELVELRVPIVTGEVKLPVLPDNWAVKTFPASTIPALLKGTDTVEPAHKQGCPIFPVIMLTSGC
jgi:hypothetical protein